MADRGNASAQEEIERLPLGERMPSQLKAVIDELRRH
jgi:hypothetical protein